MDSPFTERNFSRSCFDELQCRCRTQKPKVHLCTGNHVQNAKNPDSEALHEVLNNNTSVNVNLMDEILIHNTAERYNICNFWGNWRTSTPIVSEEDNSDDSANCSVVYVSPSVNLKSHPLKDKDGNYSCQRIVPFTGKTIWKSSCARTSIWTFSRKGLNSSKKIETDTKHFRELNSDEICLGENTEKNDEESSSKKRKLDLLLEDLPSLNFMSTIPTLDECTNAGCSRLINISFANEENHENTSEPPSCDSRAKDVSLTGSRDIEQVNIPDVSTLSSRPEIHEIKNCPNSKTFKIPKLSQIIKNMKPPAFKIPLKSHNEKNSNFNCISKLNAKETSILSSDKIDKSLTGEMCSSLVASLQKFGSNDMSDCILSEVESNTKTLASDDGFTSESSSKPETGNSTGVMNNKLIGHPDKENSLVHVDRSEHVVGSGSTPDEKPVAICTTPDILKAYEDDVLLIDVIPDDPDLFNCQSNEERTFPKYCSLNVKSSAAIEKPKTMPLIWKDSAKKTTSESDRNNNTPPKNGRFESCMGVINDFLSKNDNDSDNKQELVQTCMPSNEEPERTDDTMDMEDDDSSDLKNTTNFEMISDIKKSSREGETSVEFGEFLPNKHTPLLQSPYLLLKPECQLNENRPRLVQNVQFSRRDMPPQDLMTQNSWEMWKRERTLNLQPLQQFKLPFGYCKYFFNTATGCRNRQCSYIHIPRQNEEKICMDLLRNMIRENNISIFERAICVFISYFNQYPPRINYDEGVFDALLTHSLKLTWWNYVFHLLETPAAATFLPSVDIIIKVFEQLVYKNLETALFRLMRIFGKFLDAGMTLTLQQTNHIITILNQLPNPRVHVNFFLSMKKSRFEMQIPKKTLMYDLDTAVDEIENCKVNSDWMKLGTLYLNVCTGRENVTDLKKFSGCIAEALMTESIEDRPEIPYCVFAETIIKDPQLNDMHKTIVGRIGISVMFFYHRKELWQKGRRVLYKFRDLQIKYTFLKGITDEDNRVSRCSVINVAVDILLRCGRLNGAVQILKDSDWFMNSTMWPCDKMDVLKHHNVLCSIVHEALSKSMFNMCFEVLQNLPCFRDTKAEFNISQYSLMFNKVLGGSLSNRSLGISSSIVDFMMIKKIPVEYFNLQELIKSLGHSNLWPKARDHYKCALSLGFYSVFEGTTNPKLLHIPSFMSEVEMLLTLERFMVSNSSTVKLSDGCSQNLQIILRKLVREDNKAVPKDSYQAASERLLEASRLSSPKLFIKHMTLNNNNEHVYILDQNSCVKWLNENKNWAENIWGFH